MFFFLSYIDHTSLFSLHEKEIDDNLVRVVGSVMDIMFVLNYVQVIQNVQHMNCSARYTTDGR